MWLLWKCSTYTGKIQSYTATTAAFGSIRLLLMSAPMITCMWKKVGIIFSGHAINVTIATPASALSRNYACPGPTQPETRVVALKIGALALLWPLWTGNLWHMNANGRSYHRRFSSRYSARLHRCHICYDEIVSLGDILNSNFIVFPS